MPNGANAIDSIKVVPSNSNTAKITISDEEYLYRMAVENILELPRGIGYYNLPVYTKTIRPGMY